MMKNTSTVPDSLVVPASAGKGADVSWWRRLNFRLKAVLRTKWDSRNTTMSVQYRGADAAPLAGAISLAWATDEFSASCPPFRPVPSPLSRGRRWPSGRMRGFALVSSLLILIAGCGPDENYTVPGLTKMLQDSDPAMRYTAAEQLGAYGVEAKSAVPELTQALKDSDPSVRFGAAYALGSIGVDAESALPELTEAFKDPDAEVRLGAVYAISAVGLTSPAALPVLQEALEDEDERVRIEAFQGIRKLEAAAKYRQSAPSAADQSNSGEQ